MTSKNTTRPEIRTVCARAPRLFALMALCAAAFGLAGTAVTKEAQAASNRLPGVAGLAHASGDARAPYGWVDFCRREPVECAVNSGEPDRVELDERAWQTIRKINTQVNKDIQAITDMDHWGIVERWDIPTDGMGDCEDYVLLKRQRLAQAGFPRSALRATVVVDAAQEGHAVLMLRTNRGDFILDNKRDAILPWGQTGYMFIKRERHDRIGWTSLGGAVSPAETAAR